MKRWLFTVFVFLPGVIYSQSFWNKAEDGLNSNKSHIIDKSIFRDSIILISGSFSDASCPGHGLKAYNLSGQNTWNGISQVDLVTCDSNFIYTAGYIPIDDVVGYEQLVISKYDGSGNLIFSIGYPEVPHFNPFYFQPKSIDIASDGTLLVSSTRSVAKSGINGDSIQEYVLNLDSEIVSVSAIHPLLYLINTGYEIYTSDSSFNLSDSILFPEAALKVQVINDTIYALFESAIVRLDSALTIIDTLLTGDPVFYTMEFYDNHIWLQSLETDSIRLFKSQNGIMKDTISFPLFVNEIENIVTGTNFIFAGNSFSNQVGIYHFNYDSTVLPEIYLRDIELSNFIISNIIIDSLYNMGDSIAVGYWFNTTLNVTNNGNDTINGFSVYSELEGEMNCAQNFIYRKFSNTVILPGQSIMVNLGQAYQFGINSVQLCFECVAPDSQLEKIVNNNTLCKTITLTGVQEITDNSLKIYPNPVFDILYIETNDDEIDFIELTDIGGKKCMSTNVTGNKTTIETSSFVPGFYLLKIHSGNKIYVQRVVKM